jgi:hypothetical protein
VIGVFVEQYKLKRIGERGMSAERKSFPWETWQFKQFSRGKIEEETRPNGVSAYRAGPEPTAATPAGSDVFDTLGQMAI